MSYIDNNLLEDEKVIYRTKPSWVVAAPSILLFVFAVVVMMYLPKHKELSYLFYIAGVLYLIYSWMVVTFTDYAITTRRIIAKRGMINISTVSLLLKKVESVDLYQNFLGRMMNYGSVSVGGTGGTKDVFGNIRFPSDFRNNIQKVIHESLND